MSGIINYGVIGCGMMGQEHLRNIALLPEARVAAIFEPDPDMAHAAAALAPSAQMCPGVDALLAVEPLDALVVVSPNHLHVAQMEQIAARRPLPLLMEKPLYTAWISACLARSLMCINTASIFSGCRCKTCRRHLSIARSRTS